MSLTNHVDRPVRTPWRVVRMLLRGAGVGVLVLAGLGLLAWSTLYWAILPRIGDWRPQIERLASTAVGLPVQIGRISITSPGWVPRFELTDVVLRDVQGREALRLPQVVAGLDVAPLLAGRLRFDALHIEGARLEVRRDAQGRIHVAGLDVADAAPGAALDGAAAADWFFDQPEFAIAHGSLRWIDEQRAAPPLDLSDVALQVRRRLLGHELQLQATPPAGWGQRLSLHVQAQAPLLARPGDWLQWRGTLQADLPRVDMAQLHRHVGLPFTLQRGAGAVHAKVEWDRGVALAATMDLGLRDVSLRLQPELAPLDFAALGLRLVAQRNADGAQVKASDLSFTLADGRTWPASSLSLTWRQAGPGTATGAAPVTVGASVSAPVTGGQFEADRLDLPLLADLAERLPLGVGLRQLLRQLQPVGQVLGLQAGWDGPLDAPLHYRAKARMTGLAIAAAPQPQGLGRPGWRGAQIEFSADQSGGDGRLVVDHGQIELPGVFEQAVVPLTHFEADLAWRLTPPSAGSAAPQIDVRVSKARFENDDATGELQAHWHSGAAPGVGRGARLPGVLELSGRIARGRATRIARYLPLGLPESPRDWVRGAVQAGSVSDVDFRVRGDLADFPFINQREGDFRIAGTLRDATLAPVPAAPRAADSSREQSTHWPAFTQLNGQLVFERGSMQFSDARAKVWGLSLSDVNGAIRELGPQARLDIQGHASGPANELLRYAAATPVGEWLAGALGTATVQGGAELKLALALPLAQLTDTTVQGSLALLGGDLQLRPDWPLLAAARGRIDFTQQAWQLGGAGAHLAGGEVAIDGGGQADGSLHLVVTGQASMEALKRLPQLAPLAPWAARLRGQTGYRLQYTQPRAGPAQWQLNSALTGLAIDLPAPLGKPAEAPLALRLSLGEPLPSGTGGSAKPPVPGQQWLQLALGDKLLQAALLLDAGQTQAKVLSGALALGTELPEPLPGLQAALVLPRLDLDAWRGLAQGGVGAAAGDGAALPPGLGLPRLISLRADELLLAGRRLSKVDLELSRLSPSAAYAEPGWRAQLVSDQASGTISYREPRPGAAAGRVFARLSHLALPPDEADGMTSLLDRADGSVPALDLAVDDFELRGRKLGALAVEALNLPGADGGRGTWDLTRLSLTLPEATLTATGQWAANAAMPRGPRRMALNFKLDLADSGGLLERLGFGRVLRGGKGELAGALGWQGSPLKFDLASMEGRMTLKLASGQFVKVDPGAGRLLGVLSLQSLPRRLALDFRDLFDAGFDFDNASGDLVLAQGSARTNNLRFRGLQAAVLMEGSADVVKETQNLHVVVVPEINAGTASLAYAAINPAVGLGTFLGQWLLRGPLSEAGTQEFGITGTWDDPQVKRLARSSPSPGVPSSAATGVPSAGKP